MGATLGTSVKYMAVNLDIKYAPVLIFIEMLELGSSFSDRMDMVLAETITCQKPLLKPASEVNGCGQQGALLVLASPAKVGWVAGDPTVLVLFSLYNVGGVDAEKLDEKNSSADCSI